MKWTVTQYIQTYKYILNYRPFYKTLPRSSVSVNRISVRFYEMDCIAIRGRKKLFFYRVRHRGTSGKYLLSAPFWAVEF